MRDFSIAVGTGCTFVDTKSWQYLKKPYKRAIKQFTFWTITGLPNRYKDIVKHNFFCLVVFISKNNFKARIYT